MTILSKNLSKNWEEYFTKAYKVAFSLNRNITYIEIIKQRKIIYMAFPFGKLVEHEQNLTVTNIKYFRKMLSTVASLSFLIRKTHRFIRELFSP